VPFCLTDIIPSINGVVDYALDQAVDRVLTAVAVAVVFYLHTAL